MSQENLELVRALWEPFKGVDNTAIDWDDEATREMTERFWSPEIELRWSRRGPEARVYQGREAVINAFRDGHQVLVASDDEIPVANDPSRDVETAEFGAIVARHVCSWPFAAAAAMLASWGIASFLPHRRGYGNSPGPAWREDVPATPGTKDYDDQLFARLDAESDDVIAALAHVSALPQVKPDHIGVMGSSFGGTNTLFAASNKSIKLLRSIPGVGRCTAEVVVAYLDNPQRFENGRQVSAYAGLVPKQFQSGETDRQGHISRRGPSLLRKMLVEAGWVLLRYNSWAQRLMQRLSRGQKTRRKQAIVALARKLLVRCWAMLRDSTAWREPPPATATA